MLRITYIILIQAFIATLLQYHSSSFFSRFLSSALSSVTLLALYAIVHTLKCKCALPHWLNGNAIKIFLINIALLGEHFHKFNEIHSIFHISRVSFETETRVKTERK